jgi:hypothetical protein
MLLCREFDVLSLEHRVVPFLYIELRCEQRLFV